MSFGTNGKLSEIAAAAALASLEDWPHNRERLLVLGKLAVEKSNLAGLEVVGGLAGGYATPYWVVRCKTIDDREGLRQSLESRGIETRLWWAAGMHRMPAFAGIPGKSSLPETDRWASTYLGLPMHTHLDPAEIEMIGLILQEQAM
jgi:dTDP-4-amino-4,6-dideoxygalactose transaminase